VYSRVYDLNPNPLHTAYTGASLSGTISLEIGGVPATTVHFSAHFPVCSPHHCSMDLY
jgi:hypothetical protein